MPNLMSAVNINVPSDVKKEANAIFNNLGLNMSTAMNMFLKRVIYERGIPFDVKEPKPSKETIKALKEAEDIITGKVKAKGYKDINELRKALLSDD